MINHFCKSKPGEFAATLEKGKLKSTRDTLREYCLKNRDKTLPITFVTLAQKGKNEQAQKH